MLIRKIKYWKFLDLIVQKDWFGILGIHIKSITIVGKIWFPSLDSHYANNAALLNLINYCSDSGCMFDKLEIRNFGQIESKPRKHLLPPIFERLNYLPVYDCHYEQYVGYCRNLKELEMLQFRSITRITSSSSSMNKVFNKLETFTLSGSMK